MTITQGLSAPLVAVVGATGTQGSSIIRALAESNVAYHVRGFTRDAAKLTAQELAKLSVAVIEVSLVVENKDAAYKVFAGADFAFVSLKSSANAEPALITTIMYQMQLVMNFWEHIDIDRVHHSASWTGIFR
jgi:uncharacterized protein YbjT (DUF2867 family)